MRKLLSGLSVAALALTAAAAGTAAAPQSAREHLFVGFTKTPGVAERALVARYGGTVRYSFPSVDALAIDLDGARISDLAQQGGVAYIEEDPERVPMDLGSAELTPSLTNGLYGLVTTHAVAAQNAGFTGAGVKACVADTGLDTTHPDIAGNFVAGYNAFDPTNANDVDVFSLGVAATETHGTHVAGTLLGVHNSVGVLGVAPSAELYFARVLGTYPDGVVTAAGSSIMDGVQWLADQGCKVVNLSIGGSSKSRTEQNFYEQIVAGGTLVVAAAGNAGAKKLSYPAGYPVVVAVGAVDRANAHAGFSNTGRGIDLSAPGVAVLSSVPDGLGFETSVTTTSTFTAFALEHAGQTNGTAGKLVSCGLALSASDCPASVLGNIALIQRGTNTFGEKAQSAMAAGAAAAIIYNDVAGDFLGTLGAADNNGAPWIPVVAVSDVAGATLAGQVGSIATVTNSASSWDTWDGTSMAAPHVSGVAALVYEKNGSLSPAQVESILESTATDLGARRYDNTFGYGLVDATAALAATP